MSEMDVSPATQARRLLRAARRGALATSVDGQPFVSLVTPATAPDGSILLLLSELSEHTRQLRAEPRCALMVEGTATTANAQTAPRLTVTGLAAPEPDAGLKARWVALHPYAGFYAGFGDFSLWRVRPGGGLFIGGFASAHRVKRAELLGSEVGVAAIGAAEAGIIAHCNGDHPEAMEAIGGGAGWRMAACDVDGFDLVRGDAVRRVEWPSVVDGPGAVRAALIHLAGAAKSER